MLHPPPATLGEYGLQVAFEQGAGILQVLFGVGAGDSDAVKRIVEDADDALLFGEWRNRNWNFSQTTLIQFRHCESRDEFGQVGMNKKMDKPVVNYFSAMWTQYMGMVVNPTLTLNGKSSALAGCPFSAIFANEHQRLIE